MRKVLLTITAILTFLFACKKTEDPLPEPEPTPVTPVVDTGGWISGKVSLYDAFGAVQDSTAGTATVTIEETGNTVVTDNKGKFALKGVKTGTYTLRYTKTNYGTIKTQGLVYKVGDKGNYNAELAMLPNYQLNSAEVKDTTWFSTPIAGIYYRAYSAETNTNVAAVAIVSSSANLSISDPTTYQYDMPVSLLAKANDYNRFVSYTFLKDNYEIFKGGKVYIKLYPVASKASSYYDLKLKRPVYTAYGPALGTTFTITVK